MNKFYGVRRETNKTNLGKRLKPVLKCPYCNYSTLWATDRASMLKWHHHIKECKKTEEKQKDKMGKFKFTCPFCYGRLVTPSVSSFRGEDLSRSLYCDYCKCYIQTRR